MSDHRYAVIMAGGSGTRFWPASRQSRPKQFLSLASDRALLRLTFDRIVPLIPPDRIWVVTAEATDDLSEIRRAPGGQAEARAQGADPLLEKAHARVAAQGATLRHGGRREELVWTD